MKCNYCYSEIEKEIINGTDGNVYHKKCAQVCAPHHFVGIKVNGLPALGMHYHQRVTDGKKIEITFQTPKIGFSK